MTMIRMSRRTLRAMVLTLGLCAAGCSGGEDADALQAPVKSVAVRPGSVSDAMPTLEINTVDGTAIDHSVPPEPKPLITIDPAPTANRDGTGKPRPTASDDKPKREDEQKADAAPKPLPAAEAPKDAGEAADKGDEAD